MRKVTLKITAKIMVPIMVSYNVVANAEENVSMERIALAALKGVRVRGISIEDSSFDKLTVEDSDPDTETLDEQICEYIESEDSLVPKYIIHEVVDSR